MKANLAQREPLYLDRWKKGNLYGEILKKGEGRPMFVLHDGPPYANGSIHLGHVMNKTLKDFVVKSKSMSGFKAPYVPGWDCHGLPIEHQVMKKLGSSARKMSAVELRRECRAYAEKYVDIQRKEFERLGVFGDWEHPYRTMDFAYQAQIVREFGKVVERGGVYRSRKAVHWCISCKTALAEAEIEYENHRSPSIYVSYPVVKGWVEATLPDIPANQRFAVIWTTTPWTLPASMAIAYSEKENYVAAAREGSQDHFIVAEALLPMIERDLGGAKLIVKARIGSGAKLAGMRAHHPFLSREIPFYPGEHVTMESGTGLVHTAPGHGEEDYELGLRHNIDIYSPVEADGRFDSSVDEFAGLGVFEANPKIVDRLAGAGRLFAPFKETEHSYPHCWRCKKPVIFRATAQWFISMTRNDLRACALKEIDRVRWVPSWGRERIFGMISARPDWCLSRQRVWGVPVVAFVCRGCGENLLSAPVISHVAGQFEAAGADVWFEKDARDLLPSGTSCMHCGGKEFDKGGDILDVWFDSGVSHAAVLDGKKDLSWPCDLYLEGSDQHRGWFHSSLLQSVATRGHAPYKSVVTHGFVVDGDGRKMSKSVGNVLAPDTLIAQHGAEVLRLWVGTEDYRGDVRLSKEILDRVVESYRRIRNTARFCLGNLYDFNPDQDRIPFGQLSRDIDRWSVDRLSRLIVRVRNAYDAYEFHTVVQALNEYCVVDLSSLYLDISKDVLYCDRADSNTRRGAQTALFDISSSLALLMAPILSVTAEEIWEALPAFQGKTESVHLADFPKSVTMPDDLLAVQWEKLLAIRSEVSRALENLRRDKKIGQSLEASVEVEAPPDFAELLSASQSSLAALWIVSSAKIVSSISARFQVFESTILPGLRVGVARSEDAKCERCWNYREDVGSVKSHATLCRRCAEAVG